MFISPLAHDFEPANSHNDNMKLVRLSDFFALLSVTYFWASRTREMRICSTDDDDKLTLKPGGHVFVLFVSVMSRRSTLPTPLLNLPLSPLLAGIMTQSNEHTNRIKQLFDCLHACLLGCLRCHTHTHTESKLQTLWLQTARSL